jgi:orotidine-5'-phosphate decarboxylase
MNTRFVEAQDDLIVALDVPTIEGAVRHARTLEGLATNLKIGLELVTHVGAPRAVNTVKGAMKGVEALDVWGVTVMAGCGPDSLKAAVEHAGKTRVIGVTVLTSLDNSACRRIYGNSPLATTLAMCEMLVEAGVSHVVCSPLEVEEIMSKQFGLIPITPGIRPADGTLSDQKRVMTPSMAIKAQRGGGHIVVGRPILEALDPRTAAQTILEEMAAAY